MRKPGSTRDLSPYDASTGGAVALGRMHAQRQQALSQFYRSTANNRYGSQGESGLRQIQQIRRQQATKKK